MPWPSMGNKPWDGRGRNQQNRELDVHLAHTSPYIFPDTQRCGLNKPLAFWNTQEMTAVSFCNPSTDGP